MRQVKIIFPRKEHAALAVGVVTLVMALVGCQVQPDSPANAMEIGIKAPDFSLRDAQGKDGDQPVTLSGLVAHGPVVIIFHRGLNCPVCVQFLVEIARHIAEFKSAGIQVIAIGPDTLPAAREAIDSYGVFPMPMLSDPDDSVARAFQLASPDGYMHGVFVIDRERRIRVAEKSNEPVGETAELIAAGKRFVGPS